MLKRIPLPVAIVAILVVVASVALLLTVPRIRYEREMTAARAKIASRNFSGAVPHLTNAVERGRGRREAILLLADTLRVNHPDQAFQVLVKGHELGTLEPQDYPSAAILGYESGEAEKARQLLAFLDEKYPQLRRIEGVRAVDSFFQGRPADALRQLDEVLALDPEWATALFWKGQLLRQSPSHVDRIQAKQALVQAAESNRFDGLRACLALADSRSLALSDAEKLTFLQRALLHPWASAEWRLIALTGLVRFDAEHRDQYVDDAISTLGQAYPLMVAHWLNRIGEYDRALDLLPEGAEVPADSEAFEERFLALTLSGKLDDAETLIVDSEDQDTLKQATRLFMLSLGRNEMDEAIDRWNAAYSLAVESKEEGALIFLARGAIRIGYLEGALSAFDSLFGFEGFADRAPSSIWVARFSAELMRGGYSAALAVIREANAHYPSDLIVLNNRLYLELLMDDHWEETFAAIRPLVGNLSELPDPVGIGSTLALALVRSEQPEEALGVIERIRVIAAGGGIPDSARAVEVVVLAANQRVEEAVRTAGLVNRSRLMPLEWDLIASYRGE